VADAVKLVTDKLDTALELDGSVYRYTTNALEQAPTGGSAPSAAEIRIEIDANSTQLAAIKAKTDNLPNDPADASVIAGRFDTLDTSIADVPTVAEFNARTIAAANYALEATLTSMKGATFDTSTDSLEALRNRGDAAWVTATGFSTHNPADVVTALGTGSSLTALATASALDDVPTATENADALLKRDMSEVTGEAARSPINALRRLRNKSELSGATLTTYKEDDSTSAWTAAVTTDADAEPITSVDPA
jgi:hypothetical protein